jgi:hypothetical protein
MTTDNFCSYLQNRLIQTSQTGGQWYNDTSPFSIPCAKHNKAEWHYDVQHNYSSIVMLNVVIPFLHFYALYDHFLAFYGLKFGIYCGKRSFLR